MPLMGSAAVAMWWEVDAAQRVEFEDWHSHEHLPERLAIPGFHRGSRWASAAGDGAFFVMYELAAYDTLTSPEYRARLNQPTPWSAKMMPHHLNMVRSQCQVVASVGGGVADAMMTIRLSPEPGQSDRLRAHLQTVLTTLATLPGVTGGHLLQTRTPDAPPTAEQKIRGGDAVADWIVLLSGYDADRLEAAAASPLGRPALTAAGAQSALVSTRYGLRYTLSAADMAGR